MTVLDTLIELVEFRTAAISKTLVIDEHGNNVYQEKSIFERKDVETTIKMALTAFNAIPPFTYIKLEDEENIIQLSDSLVTYATHLLLQRQALLEKGREFVVQDNGVGWTPPVLSQFLFDFARDLRDHWVDRTETLKGSASFYNDFIKDPE